MDNPIEAQETVSRGLSDAIAELLARLSAEREADEPLTLGEVREALADDPAREELLREVDELTARFGEGAAAVTFLRPRASELLSRVIEMAVQERQDEAEAPVTLNGVLAAMHGGLVARMEAAGEIDADDEQSLVAEIERLIETHGGEALAEELIRYY